MAKKKKEEIVEQINNKDVEPLLTRNFTIYQYIDLLLDDRTTNKKIVFAENEYEELGYKPEDHYTKEIMEDLIDSKVLNYRVRKSIETQKGRTKKKAEVFTPSKICKDMIDMCEPPEGLELIYSTWLEITCGEAPYITSRYDATTGEKIPIYNENGTPNRIGILDRKLHVVNSLAQSKSKWVEYGLDALRSTYGYEYQGDNLFIARVNVLKCFMENYYHRWQKKLPDNVIKQAIKIITWNFWQMDGLNDKVPFTNIPAKIMDWSIKDSEPIEFRTLKGPVAPEILAEEQIENSLTDIFNALSSVSKITQTKLINEIKTKLDDSFNNKKEEPRKKKTTKKKETSKDKQPSLFDI